MHNVTDLTLINFPMFESQASFLMTYEGNKTIPFEVNRLFTIHATEAVVRGKHAHKACSQLLIVLEGACRVVCDDGIKQKAQMLTHPSQGLFIPPSLWAEQHYEPNTVLMVLADKPYDESDYLRNYQEFLTFRGVS